MFLRLMGIAKFPIRAKTVNNWPSAEGLVVPLVIALNGHSKICYWREMRIVIGAIMERRGGIVDRIGDLCR